MGMRCGRAPQIVILSMRLSLTHITITDRPLLFLALTLAFALVLLLPSSCRGIDTLKMC